MVIYVHTNSAQSGHFGSESLFQSFQQACYYEFVILKLSGQLSKIGGYLKPVNSGW